VIAVLVCTSVIIWYHIQLKKLTKHIELQQKRLEIKSKVIKNLYESKAIIHKQLK
jgi:hypothetical protein